MSKTDILFIFNHSPYGSMQGKEGLDALLAATVFDQQVSVVFIGPAALQLIPEQQADILGRKSLSSILQSLALYDIDQAYVQTPPHLDEGLFSRLLPDIKQVDNNTIGKLINESKTVLTY